MEKLVTASLGKKVLSVFLLVFLTAPLDPVMAESGKEGESTTDKLMQRQKLELLAFFAKDPSEAKLPNAAMAVPLYNQAVELFEKQQYALAQQMVEKAIRADDVNGLAYELLGDIYYVQGNLKEAKAQFQIAHALQPSAELSKKIEKLTNESKVEQKFSTYEEEHFVIKYHDSDKTVEGFELRELLRETYRNVSQDLSFYFDHQIVVLLYSEEEFRQLSNSPHWAGGLYDGKVRMPMRPAGAVDQELKALTRHEVTHAFIASISRLRAPAWINEGLAVYEENKERPYDLLVFNAAVRTQTLMPIDELMNLVGLGGQTDALKVALFYQQSFKLISYLIERYGMFNVKEMLKAYGQEKTGDEVVRTILHLSPQKLEQEWKSTLTSKSR